MKLLTSLVMCAALATTAFSEAISIQSPTDGATVRAGSRLTVEVLQHNTLGNFIEAAVAIGLGAPNIAPAIGPYVLYNGLWHTQPVNNGLMQNFTVTIPQSTSAGLMSLNVAHFFLAGADLFPTTVTVNITLNVV